MSGILLFVVVEGDSDTVDVIIIGADKDSCSAHEQRLVANVYDVVHVADDLDLHAVFLSLSELLGGLHALMGDVASILGGVYRCAI